MAVPDLMTVIQDKVVWLEGDKKRAYLSGVRTALALSKGLVKGAYSREWHGNLHGLASRTYMGPLRQGQTISAQELCNEVEEATEGIIVLTEGEVVNAELLESRERGVVENYGAGMFDGVDVAYGKGFKHFVQGWAFSPEEGMEKIMPWIDELDQDVQSLLEDREGHIESSIPSLG